MILLGALLGTLSSAGLQMVGPTKTANPRDHAQPLPEPEGGDRPQPPQTKREARGATRGDTKGAPKRKHSHDE